MSNSCAQKMNFLNSKENLLLMFIDRVDEIVIEDIIESRDYDLTKAYEDLLVIANSSNLEHLHSSSNDYENQHTAVADTVTTNFIDWDRLSDNKTPIDRITYLISKFYKVMILMRGCPGSGKSFQAINILNLCYQNANVDEFIFSADKFFIDKKTGKYNFNGSKLKFAHKWAFNNAKKAVEHNITPVIIDNTNVNDWEMNSYAELAVFNGYWIEIIEPVTEWAWDIMQLVNKTKHSVPYDKINLMLQRYDHSVTRKNLLTKLKLSYCKNNMPPQPSCSSRKYELNENLIYETKVMNTSPTEINHFKDFCISENSDHTKNNQCTSINNSDKNPEAKSLVQEKKESSEVSELENSFSNVLIVDEECQSISSDEGASNYVNKSVNTYENEFLFMDFLNEIPEEEYSKYVLIGKSRNINEGSQNYLNFSISELDKGTSTDDYRETILKPDLTDIHEVLPDISSLIAELNEYCQGNVDSIWELLIEYGYNLTKQQLEYLLQFKEGNVQIEKTENKIDPKQKKLTKKSNSKKVKFKTINENVETIVDNIENKFVLNSLLESNKKKNKNILENITSDRVEENLISVKDDKEKFVHLVVDTSVLSQLCDYFHDFSSNFDKNTPMSVQIPEKLAEDLYCCLITSLSTDICNPNTILQDEILARKLQEEGGIIQKNPICTISNRFSGENTFAAILTKAKLLEKYKNLNPMHVISGYQYMDYKFQETCDYLNNKYGIKSPVNSPINQDNPIIIEKKKNVNEVKDNKSSDQNYEQQIVENSRWRNRCIIKANESFSRKNPAVAEHYLKQAKQCKEYESFAKSKILEEQFKKKMGLKELDLHHLPVYDAIEMLDIFLDGHISTLRNINGGFRLCEKLTIITGRGKHSTKNKARIRPAVFKRISERSIVKFEQISEGVIMVIINNKSFLTSEIKHAS